MEDFAADFLGNADEATALNDNQDREDDHSEFSPASPGSPQKRKGLRALLSRASMQDQLLEK